MKADDITAADLETIDAAMQSGVGYSIALQEVLSISRRTAIRWKQKGEAELEAGDDTPLARLSRVIARNEGARIAKAERLVHGQISAPADDLATKDQLHNARWVLKSLLRDEYGDEVSVKLQGAVETLLSQVEPHMPRQSYADLLSALATVAGMDFGTDDESGGGAAGHAPA